MKNLSVQLGVGRSQVFELLSPAPQSYVIFSTLVGLRPILCIGYLLLSFKMKTYSPLGRVFLLPLLSEVGVWEVVTLSTWLKQFQWLS
jgi:hypothetical protein